MQDQKFVMPQHFASVLSNNTLRESKGLRDKKAFFGACFECQCVMSLKKKLAKIGSGCRRILAKKSRTVC
uniref:Uncharacterized protein n=1 Tax=Anguilla anguilla TaxID=7936 RepID=A0A0E9WIP2_ANGAN